MHLDLDVDGNPKSPLVTTLSGRSIDLMTTGAASHPRQIVGPKATAVGHSLERVMEGLGALPSGNSMALDPTDLCEDFRRLVYDATELFDVYAQLLPDRFAEAGKAAKSALSDYRSAAKRLRGPWAVMCNRFKHDGSRLAYSRAVSMEGGSTSHGYVVLSPQGGTTMARDGQVHKGREQRATFARKLHELVHAILRIDLNAAKLAAALPDGDGSATPVNELAFPFGSSLESLASAYVVVGAEPTVFDGIELPGDGTIALVRKSADCVIHDFKGTTHIVGDGHSTSYSFV